MRVTAPADARDRGAVLVLFSVFIVVLAAFAALVIDSGKLRTARGSLENATESAALGAGQTFAQGKNGCTTQAGRLLKANDPQAKLMGCASGTNKDGTGWVTVAAERTVTYTFGRAVGVPSATTSATTTVRFQPPCVGSACGGGSTGTTSKLRPLGICAQNSLLVQWQKAGKPNPSSAVEIAYDSDGPCKSTEGEFAVVDFNGDKDRNKDTKEWNANGFDGEIKAGEVLGTDEKVISGGDDFDKIVGKRVVFVIYDQLVDVDKKDLGVRVSAFVEADVIAVNDSGSKDKRSITIRFVQQIEKACCTVVVTPPPTSSADLEICDVDGTLPANCRN